MRDRATKGGGRLALLLSLFLVNFGWAQIQVISPLYREKIVKPGEKLVEKIMILNKGKTDIEVSMFFKDYKLNKDGTNQFLEPGIVKRSNTSFMQIEYPKFLLEINRQVEIKIPVQIPNDIKKGSYYSLLFIRPQAHIPEGKPYVGIKTLYQTAIQIIHTIPGKKEVKIIKVEVDQEKEILFLDVQNTGNEVFDILFAKVEIEGIKKDKVRIYPEGVGRFEFDLSSLPDFKEYKNIRVVFDDGDEYLKSERIDFIKGIEADELELARIKTKKIRQGRRGKPFTLGFTVGTGTRQKLVVNLVGNINMKNMSLNFGGNHSEYLLNDFNSFRVSGNWKPSRSFSAGVGTMAFINNNKIRYTSMLRGSLSHKKTRINLSYGLEYKIINVSLSQRLWKNLRLSLYYMNSPWRNEWRTNVFIPIF